MSLNKHLIAQLATEIPPVQDFDNVHKGFAVAEVDHGFLDAFLRLTELLDSPEQAPVLAPMIVREIHSRLLMSPQGGFLRRLTAAGTQSNLIAKTICWLRENYRETVQVEDLAGMVNMAPSTFHRHFRQVTTISPVQFQKRLRLYEAQRLMLTDEVDANNAALSVGYESVSQFNREYKRLFGDPPHRNVKRLSGAEIYA
jgi:transcriptional regulator GlxA family with amidase domain